MTAYFIIYLCYRRFKKLAAYIFLAILFFLQTSQDISSSEIDFLYVAMI